MPLPQNASSDPLLPSLLQEGENHFGFNIWFEIPIRYPSGDVEWAVMLMDLDFSIDTIILLTPFFSVYRIHFLGFRFHL